MKVLSSLLFILMFLNVNATSYCGMHLIDEEALQVYDYREQLKLNQSSARMNDDGQLITIPVKVHIFGTSAGEQRYNIESLLVQLDELNESYLPTGFYFYLVPDINIVDNDMFIGDGDKDVARKLLGNMISRHYHYGAVNIYYTSNTGLCGMAPFPFMSDEYGGRTGVLMDINCSKPGEMTLPHEFGHHFDLLHTFQGSDSENSLYSEYVTRIDSLKNCTYAGDGFCDTPADILDYSCPYTGDAKDLRGQYYVPDVSLIMSYHADRCQNKFSEQQIQHMREVVFNDTARTVYLKNQIADFSGVEATSLLLPTNNEEVEHSTPTVFKWDEVDGADAYLLSIVTGSGSRENPIYQSVIIGQTSHEYNFSNRYKGRTIGWKVTAFKWTQPNAIVSEKKYVKVVDPIPTSIYNRESYTFNPYPNPVNPGGSVQINLFDGERTNISQPIHVQLTALNGQLVFDQLLDFSNNQASFGLDDRIQSGIYFMSFELGDKNYRAKIIVQ